MNTDDIRQSYLNYFEKKDHKIMPSSSLIPHDDPTLLLTTAGMVQFKPYFQGLLVPPSARLASCQKCFRTTDLDSVGDYKHLTFFEMLGNFSIGDYFKQEAISWAWEFVTHVLMVKPEKLWITIYLDDDDAFDYWKELGLPENKIIRLGEKYNFWGPAGDSGPCGPCSEIHYDFGSNVGCLRSECAPDCDCGRFTEIWNLVFTQYNQSPDGHRTKLPKPNIDTGMGLERTAAIMQNVSSVYGTDRFLPLRTKIMELTGKTYGSDEKNDRAVRIISDHVRGLTFLISDGVIPSNEGRGYVLRRVLRKASFFGRKLGLTNPFLSEISDAVVKTMGHFYPEIVHKQSLIYDIINSEEKKFTDTIDAGMNLVEKTINKTIKNGENVLSGNEVFKLYDTYGFPPELTCEMANEQGLTIDLVSFENSMSKQKEKGRTGHKFVTSLKSEIGLSVGKSPFSIPRTKFTGYNENKTKAKVLCIIDKQTGSFINAAESGQEVAVILDQTPFYAEKGGQIGDTGNITSGSLNTQIKNTIWSPYGNLGEGIVVHLGVITQGNLSINTEVNAEINYSRRLDISRNHTATHLLQYALRKTLGKQVYQRGSLVANDKLRFDFSYGKLIDKPILEEIQSIINDVIRQNIAVICEEDVPYDEAISEGAIALFEEKYGDKVRILKIVDPVFSTELCGGTHVKTTGEIGFFLLLSETSIGTGLRRIEALTGRSAESYLNERLRILHMIADNLKVSHLEINDKINSLSSELSQERKRLSALEKELSKDISEGLLKSAFDVRGITVVATRVSNSSLPLLRNMGDDLKEKLKSAVIVLGTVQDDKPYFIGMVTTDLTKKGLHAGEIIKQVSFITGGNGGGKAEIAQAGGKDKEKIDFALAQVKELVEKSMQK